MLKKEKCKTIFAVRLATCFFLSLVMTFVLNSLSYADEAADNSASQEVEEDPYELQLNSQQIINDISNPDTPAYSIIVQGVHKITDIPALGGGMSYFEIDSSKEVISVQCVVQDFGYSGRTDGSILPCDITTSDYSLSVQDSEGFTLPYVESFDGDDGGYNTDCVDKVAKNEKKKLAFLFYAEPGTNEVTVTVNSKKMNVSLDASGETSDAGSSIENTLGTALSTFENNNTSNGEIIESDDPYALQLNSQQIINDINNPDTPAYSIIVQGVHKISDVSSLGGDMSYFEYDPDKEIISVQCVIQNFDSYSGSSDGSVLPSFTATQDCSIYVEDNEGYLLEYIQAFSGDDEGYATGSTDKIAKNEKKKVAFLYYIEPGTKAVTVNVNSKKLKIELESSSINGQEGGEEGSSLIDNGDLQTDGGDNTEDPYTFQFNSQQIIYDTNNTDSPAYSIIVQGVHKISDVTSLGRDMKYYEVTPNKDIISVQCVVQNFSDYSGSVDGSVLPSFMVEYDHSISLKDSDGFDLQYVDAFSGDDDSYATGCTDKIPPNTKKRVALLFYSEPGTTDFTVTVNGKTLNVSLSE